MGLGWGRTAMEEVPSLSPKFPVRWTQHDYGGANYAKYLAQTTVPTAPNRKEEWGRLKTTLFGI